MSLYDRDYARDDAETTQRAQNNWSPIALIIILNVVFWLADQASPGHGFVKLMWLNPQVMGNPLQWYRLLTAGYAHDPSGVAHLFWNMLAFFFFAPDALRRLGKLEFAVFYNVSIVLANFVWLLRNWNGDIMYAFNNPRRIVWIWGVIPLPAWVLGVLTVALDYFGMLGGSSSVAHDVHLAGAGFAAVYGLLHLRLTAWIPKYQHTSKSERRGRNRMNVQYDSVYKNLNKRVDEILAKISQYGEESLTEQERETLRYASREYQSRKQGRS